MDHIARHRARHESTVEEKKNQRHDHHSHRGKEDTYDVEKHMHEDNEYYRGHKRYKSRTEVNYSPKRHHRRIKESNYHDHKRRHHPRQYEQKRENSVQVVVDNYYYRSHERRRAETKYSNHHHHHYRGHERRRAETKYHNHHHHHYRGHERRRPETEYDYQHRHSHQRKHDERGETNSSLQVVGADLPYEILFNILSKLPIQSLCRFRSVCKSWNELMRDPFFVNLQLNHASPQPPIFIVSDYEHSSSKKHGLTYISVVMQRRNRWVATKTPIKQELCGTRLSIMRTCNGLLLLSDYPDFCGGNLRCPTVIIYNPVTRDSVTLPNLVLDDWCWDLDIYFGFDNKRNLYKVIMSAHEEETSKLRCFINTVGKSPWRSLDIPEHDFLSSSIPSNGELYWIIRGKNKHLKSILVMDMCDEKFRVIEFVDSLNKKEADWGPDYHLFNYGNYLFLCAIDYVHDEEVPWCPRLRIWHLVDKKEGTWIQQTSNSVPTLYGNIFEVVGAVDSENLLLLLRGDSGSCSESQNEDYFVGLKPVIFNVRSAKLIYDIILFDYPKNWDVHPYIPSLVNPEI